MVIAIGDIFECAAEFRLGAETGQVVFHKQVTLVEETDEAIFGNALALDLQLNAGSTIADFGGTGAFIVCATCRRIPPADPTRIYTEFGPQTPSIQMATAVAAQSAALFSTYPAPGGTPKSGRNYLPFLKSNSQVSGQILNADAPAMITSVNDWIFNQLILPAIGELKPVLYRYATMVLPFLVVDIVEMILRPVLSSQRRRVQHHQTFSP